MMEEGAAGGTVDALRDALAAHFAARVVLAVPAIRERLAVRLAETQDMEKWRPIREASQVMAAAHAGLATALQAKVRERFDAKSHPEKDTLSKTQKFSLASLQLVGDSEMQQEIAIAHTTKQLQELTARELQPLTARLAEAMAVRVLPDDRNPAFCRTFVRALIEALETAGADREVRMAAYLAAEPELARILRETYAAVLAGEAAPEYGPAPAAGRRPVDDGALDVEGTVNAAFARLAVDPRLHEAARREMARLKAALLAAGQRDANVLLDPWSAPNRVVDMLAALGLSRAGAQEAGDWAGAAHAAVDALLASAADGPAFDRALQSLESALAHQQSTAARPALASAPEEPRRADAVDTEVARRVEAGKHSPDVADFVERAWKPVMRHDHAAGGADADAYKSDLTMLDALMWSLGPVARSQSKRLASMLPHLISRLKDGLARARVAPARIEALLEEMKNRHMSLLRGDNDPAAAAQAPAARAAGSTSLQPGAWVELPQGPRRYRVTEIREGTRECILRDLEHDHWLLMKVDGLQRRLDTLQAALVAGPGIAPAAFSTAASQRKKR